MPNYALEHDECLMSNGGCDHVCTNQQGSYACSCNIGYRLMQNGHQCEGTQTFRNVGIMYRGVADINLK